MTFRLHLPDGEFFWIHALTQNDAVMDYLRMHPEATIVRVELVDTLPELRVVAGPAGAALGAV